MDNKRQARLRRARSTRAKIAGLRQMSLCVFRSNIHLYVQVLSETRDRVLVSASTNEASLRGKPGQGGNVAAAKKVGELIASRCLEKGIKQVAFDRSGYKYHGRVKVLAEAAREKGLKI